MVTIERPVIAWTPPRLGVAPPKAGPPRAGAGYHAWFRRTLPAGWTEPEHVRLINDHLAAVERGEVDRLAIHMPPRHGKALAVDTPIPTPEGWRAIGDLHPGDMVFAGDGTPTRVLAVNRWEDRPVYRVTTDDGHSVIADAAHEWLVRLCRKRPVWKVHETGWLAGRTSERRPLIPASGALQLPDADLPVPPYTLGLWLGDGSTDQGRITAGDEDIEHARAQVEADGYRTGIPPSERITFTVYGLRVHLREAGVLGNKHIPAAYLRASEAQRRALLQGLIDSDGHVAPDGQIEYAGTDERLCRDVLALVHSLGVKASFIETRATLNGEDHGACYRVMFYMAGAARLPRKAERCRDGVRTPGRFLSFEPAGRADTACITVEHPSHLFLAGRACIVTHNSETVTVRFPLRWIERRPADNVLVTGYNERFARKFSRRIRNMAAERGLVASDKSATDEWATRAGGLVMARGVGNPPTGTGFNLIVIDDPVRRREDAESEAYREKVWDWYTDDLYNRLEPGAPLVLVMTLWHEDDLGARAVAAEPGRWTVLRLPAIDAEGRALWPERYDVAALTRIRDVMAQNAGLRSWEALYQQNPTPREGSTFKVGALGYVDAADVPPLVARCRAWDLAATAGGGDYTAGVLMGRDADGLTYVLDVVRGQWDAAERNARMSETARRDGPSVTVRLPQDPGQAGKEQAKNLTRMLSGSTVKALPVSGSKEIRADPFASQVNAGHVRLVRGAWNAAFVEELRAFPNGKHDDQVDAAADAFNEIARPHFDPSRGAFG